MPETQESVINTSPIIALVAALGDLRVWQIYQQVGVPFEVSQEIAAGGAAQFALAEFKAAPWLKKCAGPTSIATHLLNTLDRINVRLKILSRSTEPTSGRVVALARSVPGKV